MHTEELLSKSLTGELKKKVFLDLVGKQHTYGDFFGDVAKMRNLFLSKGLKEGDKIFISVEGDYDIALLFLTCVWSGFTAVSVDPHINSNRAKAIFEQAEAKACVLEDHLFEKWGVDKSSLFAVAKKETAKKGALFKKLLKSSSAEATDESSYPALLGTLENIVTGYSQPSADTVAYILFTSGTTSDPKGVMITQRNLWAHIATLKKVYSMDENTRILNNLSFYHTDGMMEGPILTAFCQGTLVRPVKKFEISLIADILASIYKNRISHLIAPPTMLTLINKFSDGYEDSFQTPDFKFIISLSAHLEEHLWQNFEQTFKTRIVNVYGLTETVSGSLFSGPSDDLRKLGTVGKPVDCEVKVLDESGNALPANQEGELLIKGDHVFKGYYKNQEATDKVLKDGWLYSGDLAVQDEQGHVKITGRKKNIVIVGGFNVHPEEVSEVINTHPLVLESVCIGVKDAVFGEKLIACVVASDPAKLTKNVLQAFLTEQLEINKMPADILFYKEFPKGLAGKVQLKELEKTFGKDQAPDQVQQDVQQEIFRLASSSFKVDASGLTMSDNSQTVNGWDSMAHLHLITQLEERFNTRFGAAEIMVMNNFKSIEDILKKHLSNA